MKNSLGRRQFTALGLAALGLSNASAGTSWRLASGYRDELFHTVNLKAMAAEIEAATNGELRITVYPNNTLVKLADMRAAVQMGQVEAGETIMSSLIADIPIAGADSVPFITSSYADARRMWDVQRPLIERHFAARGLVVLYAVPWPPQGLYTVQPLADIGDLDGQRMRTYNAMTTRIAALVGATPVDLPTTELVRALAEERIDNMITSAVTGVENRVWTRLKHFYVINAWFPKNIVFVNLAATKALPPASRDALFKAAVTAEARGWTASEAAAQASVDELRRNGVKVERAPRAVSSTLKRFGERLSLEWVRKVGVEANDIFIPYFTR